MKIVATSLPKTLEEYQLALDAAWTGGQALGKALASQPAAPVQEPDWQARLTELQTVFKDVDQSGPLLGMGRPPAAQRQWVGLTNEERGQAINANFGNGLWHMAKDIEAKLREKNGGCA